MNETYKHGKCYCVEVDSVCDVRKVPCGAQDKNYAYKTIQA